MSEDRSSTVRRLVGAHLLLAIGPVGMGFVPVESRFLPLLWGLASIPLAQVMLLAIAAGMTATMSVFVRVVMLLLASAYLAIWSSVGQSLMSNYRASQLYLAAYLQNLCTFFVLLVALSLIMAGTSRVMGKIGLPTDSSVALDVPRFRYSLLSLLGLFSTASLVLAITRLSRMYPSETGVEGAVLEYTLAVIVYTLNTLAAVWATLGPGHVKRRLGVVFLAAVFLGVSLAAGAGNSPEFGTWWFFSTLTLVVIVPTAIVVLSLLYLRRHGFRLVASTTQSPDPQNKA